MKSVKSAAGTILIVVGIILLCPLIFLGIGGLMFCCIVNPLERLNVRDIGVKPVKPTIPKNNRIYIQIPREKLYSRKFQPHNRINKLVDGMTVSRQFWHGDYTLN